MNQVSELLTIKEAARALRLHPETVRRLLNDGKIPAVKIGRSWRIHLRTMIESDKN